MRRTGLSIVLVSLVLASAAGASDANPTLAEIEREVVCPTCHTTLNLSNAPIANRMRAFIRGRIAAGDSKSEIKSRLVAEFGEGVLAAPPKKGFNLLAWLLPLGGLGIAAILLGVLARRWSRNRDAPAALGGRPLDPALERRVDEELARYDS